MPKNKGKISELSMKSPFTPGKIEKSIRAGVSIKCTDWVCNILQKVQATLEILKIIFRGLIAFILTLVGGTTFEGNQEGKKLHMGASTNPCRIFIQRD